MSLTEFFKDNILQHYATSIACMQIPKKENQTHKRLLI